MWHDARCLGSSFLTLTYDQDEMPVGLSQFDAIPQGWLDPSHPRNWLKKLRRELPEYRIRYMLVGEYGDKSWRPHYHLALFGPPSGLLDEVVTDTWTYGFSSTRELNCKRSMYIAHYTTKKLRAPEKDLDGRPPEFARYSLKPALGVPQLAHLLSLYRKREGQLAIELQHGDINGSFDTGGRRWPLDRTMRTKLREALGIQVTRTARHLDRALRGQSIPELPDHDLAEAAFRELQAEHRAKTPRNPV